MALALTGRRRAAAAAVASAVAAAAIAAAVAGRGCDVAAAGPEVAVRRLVAAASAGDRAAVFALLSPQTQARLEERAARATSLVGSNVRYTALDLVAIGATSDDAPAPASIAVVSRSGDRAVVELVSAAGRARLDVVRVDGRWRVELPEYGAMP